MKVAIRKDLRRYVESFIDNMTLKSVSVEGVGKQNRAKFEPGWEGYRLHAGSILYPKKPGFSPRKKGLRLADPFAEVRFFYNKREDLCLASGVEIDHLKGIYMKIFLPEREGFMQGPLEIPRLMGILRFWAKEHAKMNFGDLGYLLKEEHLIY